MAQKKERGEKTPNQTNQGNYGPQDFVITKGWGIVRGGGHRRQHQQVGEKLHEKRGCRRDPAGSPQPDTAFTHNEANHSALQLPKCFPWKHFMKN